MVSNAKSDEIALKCLQECRNYQIMIDASCNHLHKLRAPTLSKSGHFAPTSALTKTEIRALEGKLIKYFSKQLAARASLTQSQWQKVGEGMSQYPSLLKWLSIVGVTADSADAIQARIAIIQKDSQTSSLEILKEKSEYELHRMLMPTSTTPEGGNGHKASAQRKEDHRRLSCALDHLRKHTHVLIHGQPPISAQHMNLHWDSWWDNAPDSAASHGHPLNIPRSNTGRFDTVASIFGYPLPVTPTYKSHHIGADSTDSVASSLSSGGSSIPPPSPGDVLGTDPRKLSKDSLKFVSSPPSTPPSAMTSRHTAIKTPICENNSSLSIHQALNPNEHDSLVMPPPNEFHKDAQVKGHMYSRGSESMQNIHGNEVSISYSPNTGGEFYNGSSTSLICQKQANQNEKFIISSWAEGATVMTQSVCRSSSSYISNHTTVTTSTKAAMISDCVDGSRSNVNDKISNPIICQSPVPYINSRKHEKPTCSTHHTSQDEYNYHSLSNLGPSPAASPKSPLNLQETNQSESGAADSRHAPTLQVPKSPRTPSMGHVIRHRFIKKTLFKPAKCDFCSGALFKGLKCKECKFKCHTDCEQNVPPSCGLPEEMVKYYFNHLSKENSPILTRPMPDSDRGSGFSRSATQVSGINPLHPNKPWPDSSSNTSSCNSSTPSSPNVILDSTPNPTPPHSATMYPPGVVQFTFPNPGQNVIDSSSHSQPSHPGYVGGRFQQDSTMLGVTSSSNIVQQSSLSIQYSSHQQLQQISSSHTPSQNPRSPNPLIASIQSNDSDKTLSNSSGSPGTSIRMDSQDSTEVEWGSSRQPSISLKEWDIPMEDLKIGPKIGSGQFSTVHQGNWHGDIAIKFLDMESTEDEATLEAFRKEVATFRKTRHENLILFMGACMSPPKLAIVTSLCKGDTLYTILHLKRDKFPMSKIKIIAEQIAQGMSYLHHRGIVHKDLKSKNIFFERGRAIITDFGLVNVARRLCARQKCVEQKSKTTGYERDCMSIPEGWLCYLAPEIMRTLRVRPDETGESAFTQAFTKASDVYAFGTIWFELLTGEFSWKHQPPETIIWMVGRGMKPSLANLQASKDVKDILVMCWTFKPEERPDFSILHNYLEKIPSKRLARSPSHPVHLSRSVESVF